MMLVAIMVKTGVLIMVLVLHNDYCAVVDDDGDNDDNNQ